MLSVVYAECRYAECRYAYCRGATPTYLKNVGKRGGVNASPGANVIKLFFSVYGFSH
jgi:hypothetical protein